MKKAIPIRRIAVAALGSLLACSVAGAQTRGAATPARVSATHMRAVPRISFNSGYGGPARMNSSRIRQATVVRVLPDGRAVTSFAPTANFVSFGSSYGVPGLGFDYPHLAAISGSLQNDQPLRYGRGEHRGENTYIPILFGGYPYYPYYDESQDYDQPQPQEQPQVIVIQQPVATVPTQQQGVDAGVNGATPIPAALPPAAPVSDIGDFILVRRDGRILFASAFSIAGAQLQYVSPEGIRHTLPITELDASATQQMNEARGTTIQISN